MTTSVTTTGSVELFHFNKIEKKNNQDDIITLSNNGKELCLRAGRSLSDRAIIALNGSFLGSLPFVKRAYENLEHRDAEALRRFCDAVVNVYGEDTRNIVDSYFNDRKQLKVSDISIATTKAIESLTDYKYYLKKNENLESLLKEKGYPDFNMSQLKNCDFHLINKLHDFFNNLIKDISKERLFSDNFISALETGCIDFVTSIPGPSCKFACIVAGKNIFESNTDRQQYEIDRINIYLNSFNEIPPNFTAEDLKKIYKEAASVKSQLIYSGKQDQYRYQLYADIFRKVNTVLPQTDSDYDYDSDFDSESECVPE
ncbi:TPA: hypothetical protein KV183_002266, partial [Morganella morganii]|nr:hypothetical protein [Morganella morganii]